MGILISEGQARRSSAPREGQSGRGRDAGGSLMEGRCWQGYRAHMASAPPPAFSQHRSCRHASGRSPAFFPACKTCPKSNHESSKGDDVGESGSSDP